MLIPLKKAVINDLIPAVATGSQYAYYWGDFSTFLKNLFISLIGVILFWLLGLPFGAAGDNVTLIFRIVAGLYWLWSPVYWASVRNSGSRRYRYLAFWRGKVLDTYITEELVKEESAIDRLGRLVLVESRRRLFNVEVGDRDGWRTTVAAPIKRIYKAIQPGDTVEAILLTNDPDFWKIDLITEIYIPRRQIWLGDYPYLRRDVFLDIRQELARIYGPPSSKR
ncbi:MAG: phosphate ABC transporter permease [Geminocystis sp.]|nr:phosphate ABC transporter permease [Geminocystis sp.]HIK37769.1 phosphate ABC transporter permease [Geminocystis sp. M7585_C2015_104]MCS7149077.1 phosphate ABC transporter permease [Geminocystis sp.]MCX8079585.1 phosphate ABC transporter permease [Geminocystis sp.]MDW8114867.1 phosphate ABC transporter permease [Geminocystis sp.]